jgi:hypothetical protein
MGTDKQRRQAALRQQRFRQRQQAARRVEQASKGLPPLPPIATLPGYARWRAALAAARVLVETVQEEMTAYYEERSEVWQEGEAGVLFAERQEALEALLSQWEEVTL